MEILPSGGTLFCRLLKLEFERKEERKSTKISIHLIYRCFFSSVNGIKWSQHNIPT